MDVSGFLRKAAEKTGFHRERYDERRIPTNSSNIAVMPFFGDIRSLFVLSSLLLKRYREEVKGSKYFILCSWPGFQSMFPYVDEYWGIADESIMSKFYLGATHFRNKSDFASAYYRNLNQHFFEDVILPHEVFEDCYNQGIEDGFWKVYKQIKRTLPSVNSSAQLGKEFNRDLVARGGYKIFVYPSIFMSHWKLGETVAVQISKEFWINLLQRLIKERYSPVVYKGSLAYDLSGEFGSKCAYVADADFGKVLSAMRATGCVLDVFNDISKYALAARCPFVSVSERARYVALKDYELDDICGPKLPKQYIFSFPTIIEGGSQETWDFNILNNVITRLNNFLPQLDRDEWPSTGESTEVVSYDSIRQKKSKRLGTRLLKVPND
jgi:hypothetical protein